MYFIIWPMLRFVNIFNGFHYLNVAPSYDALQAGDDFAHVIPSTEEVRRIPNIVSKRTQPRRRTQLRQVFQTRCTFHFSCKKEERPAKRPTCHPTNLSNKMLLYPDTQRYRYQKLFLLRLETGAKYNI